MAISLVFPLHIKDVSATKHEEQINVNRSLCIKQLTLFAVNARAITESNIVNCKTETQTLMQTLIYG